MIPISPRLLCCASMLKGKVVCDIGTDHAYLPAYLVTSGKAGEVIATDLRPGPLESAKGTLKRFHVEHEIKLILSDGFSKVPPKGITDVVIAGMGGETIRDILSAPSAQFIRKNSINLVLQPMTKAEVLRAWLAENGFAVQKEIAVKDTIVYTVIQAEYTGDTVPLSEAASYYGRLRRSDPLTKIYIAGVQQHLTAKMNGLSEAGHTEEAAAVRTLISEISQWLRPESEG